MPDTSPPDTLGDKRMTDAELRTVRECLGLTGDWLAAHLGVSDRTVRHWEQGKYPIPDGVLQEVEDLERRTDQHLAEMLSQVQALDAPVIVTYRSDAEYQAAEGPQAPWSASWHRAICARLRHHIPGLTVTYADRAKGVRTDTK